MKLSRLTLALGLFLSTVTPAHAGPFAALLPLVVGLITKSVILKIVLTIAASIAVSLLTRALKPKPRPAGIQTERKAVGGTVSRSVIIGEYCTAGSEICPPMSQGGDGDTPNKYLTFIINLSDMAVDDLIGLIVNGEYCSVTPLGDTYGARVGGKYVGSMWLRFYNGTQDFADPMLVSKYPSGYIRPWSTNHIGKGVAYAIITCKFDTEIYKGEPEFKFVVRGIPLYDPRKDSSVGGSGAHRWNDSSTWEVSLNPIVQTYNILRGLRMADGSSWGGECEAEDLPLANWVAGMNVCDEIVNTTSGDEPRYRAGYEIKFAEDEPADIIEELLKACSASITEVGGVYKVRVGPPALPVAYFTDGDFLVNKPQDFLPYPAINSSKNTVYASYPNPDEGWVQHDAPAISDPAYIVEDDGQEQSGQLALPTVPYPLQVQRLMLGWLKDDRRWRTHNASVGHYAFALEPLDTIAWTSEYNGYDAKLFEVMACVENLRTLSNDIGLREVDPGDYDWSSDDELPDPIRPPLWDLPDVQGVPGFAVFASAVQDEAGNYRRPAIRCVWTAGAADDATALKIQVRNATSHEAVTDWNVTNVNDGAALISAGILPNEAYEVRAMYIANRATEWTSWLSVSTANILIDVSEIDGLQQLVDDTQQALEDIEAFTAVANDLQTQVATLVDSVDDIEADVAAQASEIVDLTSEVSTQGSTISSHTTAISGLGGDLASLTTKVAAGAQNILPNGNFENGLSKWNIAFGGGTWAVQNDTAWGNYIVHNGASAVGQLSSDFIPAWEGFNYTVSGDLSFGGTADAFWIGLQFYNAAYGLLGEVDYTYKTPGQSFTTNQNGRLRRTGMSPAGTRFVRAYVAYLNAQSDAGLAARQIKVEVGNQMSPFTQEASVYQSFKAIQTQDTQIASLQSTVSTQGSSITTNSNAITTLNSNVASLTTKVVAGAQNLLPNGNFENGTAGWVFSGWFLQSAAAGGNDNGTYAYRNASGYGEIYSDLISVAAGNTYTLSVNAYNNGEGSGAFDANILWINGSGVHFSTSQVNIPIKGFAIDQTGRNFVTGTAPAGAVSARVHIAQNISGGSAPFRAVKEIKFEKSDKPSPFTQEASVLSAYTAITTNTSQLASLSSTVSTQGSSITTNSNAITTLQGNLASLSSTVSAQGSTVTSHTSAIATLNGNVTSLFARASVTLDVNGYVTGWEQNNNGSTGNMIIRTDKFVVAPPVGAGNAGSTSFVFGAWRVFDEAGTMRIIMGKLN